jgi:hypothetical protein
MLSGGTTNHDAVIFFTELNVSQIPRGHNCLPSPEQYLQLQEINMNFEISMNNSIIVPVCSMDHRNGSG